jgi:hypothetical protein
VVAIGEHDLKGRVYAHKEAVREAKVPDPPPAPGRGLYVKGRACIDAGHVAHGNVARAAAHFTAHAHAAGARGEGAVQHGNVLAGLAIVNARLVPAALDGHAIVAANVAGAKGALDGAQQSYTIAANDQIRAADSYRNIVIAYRNRAPVLLRDVAEVVEGLENTRVGGWYQGRTAIILDLQKQPGANVVDTLDRLRREMPRLQRSIPAGARIEIVNDRTGPTWFSVDASSAVPILMSMTHYDLFQGGGWATNGVPVGLTNPIQSI